MSFPALVQMGEARVLDNYGPEIDGTFFCLSVCLFCCCVKLLLFKI